ncbi:MAG: LIC12162 family protein, partial [Thermodesulfobacteriota bacterium]
VTLPEKERGLYNDLPIQTQLKKKLKSLIIYGKTKMLQILNPLLKKDVILEGVSTGYKFKLSQVSGQNLLYSVPDIRFGFLGNEDCSSVSMNIDRDVFEKLPSRNRFEEIARKAIRFGFPQFYFEKYDTILKGVTPYIEKRRKMAIAIINWYADEPFKFIAAEIADRGGRLVGLQQGGAFGATMDMASELVERYVTDVFVSSGWSEKEDVKEELCEVVPLPIPKYSKIKNSHRWKTDKGIFVGNMIPKYVYRIQTFLIPEEIEEYFNWKYNYFNKLRKDILKKFCYRPFFGDYGWNETGRIKENFPEMDILIGGNLIKEMTKCKLVVSDHLGTSYLESLIINVPTVLYWDKEIYKIRSSAYKYFDLLRDVKILHDGPVSAAAHINEVFDDINKWWNNALLQDVRMQFVNFMGLSSQNWKCEWSDFIKEQLDLA